MILDFVESCFLFVILCPIFLSIYIFNPRPKPVIAIILSSRIHYRVRPFFSGFFSFVYFAIEFFVLVASLTFLLNLIATIQDHHSAVSCG